MGVEMIRLVGITKRYGETEALRDVSLEIKKGDVFAIIGSSGAGKTTLLRIISMLETDYSGEYYLNDIDVRKNQEDLRKCITMVFQKPVMFNASVFDNVAYGLRIRGLSSQEVESRVNSVLELVGLYELRKKNAKKLSGGEQQRVALARALVLETEVLVLDEPTANLDAGNVQMIEAIIKEITDDGVTVIMATHNLFQAKRLANMVAYLNSGELVEVGSVKQIFESPEKEMTKRFIMGETYF
jgi:tungstate transport system ATP-binding protein